jgi:predicted DNA-binding protein
MKDELENIAKSYRRTLSNYLRILIENEINKSKGLPIFEL